MNSWRLVKKLLINTCVYFTLISVVILLLGLLADGGGAGGVLSTQSLLFLPFSLLMAIAQELLRADKLARWIRFVLHYVITLLDIYLFLLLPSSARPSSATLLVLFAILTLVYWILFGIIALLISRVKKLLEED